MMSHTVMAVVVLILLVLALAIVFPIIYKLLTGNHARDACMNVMSLFDTEWNLIATKIKFNLFKPLCDIILPF